MELSRKLSLQNLMLTIAVSGFATLHAQTPLSGIISSNQVLSGNCIVNSGNTLTITGCTVDISGDLYVAPNAHLIVQSTSTLKIGGKIEVRTAWVNDNTPSSTPGATLQVTNSTITAHSSAWEGIEVWGMGKYIAQGDPSVARATLDNAIVSNSYHGINDFKNLESSIYNSIFTGQAVGGVINANNTTFKNNVSAVCMAGYDHLNYPYNTTIVNDQSWFTKCNFVINGSYPPFDGNHIFYQSFVVLSHVNGVQFRGCSFNNAVATGGMKTGLIAEDAGFIITDWVPFAVYRLFWYGSGATGRTHTTFNNINRGIDALSRGYRTAVLESAIFTECNAGIFASGYPYPFIVGNNMSITNAKLANSDFRGMYIAGSQNPKIEHNIISTSGYTGHVYVPGNAPQNAAIGIIVQNGGILNSNVYNNTITGMDYSIEAIGNNRSSDGLSGLHFLCNSINTSFTKTYDIIASGYAYPNSGSTSPLTANSGICYYQGQGSAPFSAGNLFDLATRPAGSTNHLYNDLSANNFQYSYSNASRELPVYRYNMSLFATYGYGCADRFSPNGSMTVGKMQIASSNSASQIRVVLSDPNADLANLHGQIATYEDIIDSAVLTATYWDSVGIHLDSLETIFDSAAFLYDYKILLAQVYAAEGRHNDAINLLSNLNSNYTLTTDEEKRISNIITVMRADQQLYNNGNNWDGVSASLKDSLDTVDSTDDYFARYWARSYHSLYESATYGLEWWFAPDEGGKQTSINPVYCIKKDQYQVYPNPTKEKLFVIITEGTPGDLAVVADMTGREVTRTKLKNGLNELNIEKLSSGIYLLKIYDGNSIAETKQISKN